MSWLTNQGNRRAATAVRQVAGTYRRVRVDRRVRPHAKDGSEREDSTRGELFTGGVHRPRLAIKQLIRSVEKEDHTRQNKIPDHIDEN
jgi:hypothetical protein